MQIQYKYNKNTTQIQHKYDTNITHYFFLDTILTPETIPKSTPLKNAKHEIV